MAEVRATGATRGTLPAWATYAALCFGSRVAVAQPVGPTPPVPPSATVALPGVAPAATVPVSPNAPPGPAPPQPVVQAGAQPWAAPPPATPLTDLDDEDDAPRRRRPKARAPRPRKLVWKPGEAIPFGYEEREGPSLRLLIGGLASAGALYVGSTISAYILTFGGQPQLAPLFVPGIGPFITIGTADAEDTGAFLLAVNGLGQLTGITLACLSAVGRDTWLQRIPSGVPLDDSVDAARLRFDAGLGQATFAVEF